MKKLLFISSIVSLTLISCKKDYKCTCSVGSGSYVSTYSETINGTKSEAVSTCDSRKGNLNPSSPNETVKCEIK
jgi:hypothetical protein